MSKRKVLVLGCTGEIGGRVARLCADAGHEVLGVCRGKGHRFLDIGDAVTVKHGDKYDETFLKALDAEFHPQVMIDTVPWTGTIGRYARCFPNAENIFVCGSTGKYVPLRFLPADETHPWKEDTKVNIGKAARTFGYDPKVTTEEGLVKALAWCEGAGLL